MTTADLPKHIVITADGNRRWAKKKNLPVTAGHKKAAEDILPRLAEHAFARGIEHFTIWLFNTDNWKRDKKEVDYLMNMAAKLLDLQGKKLHEGGARIRLIGRRADLPNALLKKFETWEKTTKDNQKGTFTFAFNYGGRDEILRAIRKLASQKDLASIKNLSEQDFIEVLDTAGLPDPDLLIRTSGELRLSGILPWQGVYSELYFTDVLFPDFDEKELDKALEAYTTRQRRFGA